VIEWRRFKLGFDLVASAISGNSHMPGIKDIVAGR
jgi:hypothetical protein